MDRFYMKQALKEAIKGEGKVNPNPLVGAVIVKNESILSKGYHKVFGGAHAEVEAIEKCSYEELEGATIYVTLEPCSHYGKTPPCVDLIIRSKIKRCVIGVKDPNTLVAGKGIKKLKEAGIEVVVGILEKECKEINRVFFKYILEKMPYLFLKVAITLDGKIATRDFSSKWITNEISRKKVQKYRNRFTGVLIGATTANLDNPSLRCHINERDPYRIILDKNLSIKSNLEIVRKNSDKKTIVVTKIENKENKKYEELKKLDIQFIFYNKNEKLKDILKKIGELGIDSILIEGGSEVISQFFRESLFDAGEIFLAPKIIGDEHAIPFIKGFNISKISDSIELKNIKFNRYGENIGIEFYKDGI